MGFDRDKLIGRWSIEGRAVEVAQRGGDLALSVMGLPDHFVCRVVEKPDDPSGLPVVVGGPIDGMTVEVVEADGAERLVVGGVLTFPRWDASSAVPPVPTLLGPDVEVSTEWLERFRAFAAEVTGADGGVVRPPEGFPLDRWIGWLTGQQSVLFHGSSKGDIDELHPRRVSYELRDEGGRGNLAAVYATHDGTWATWFAIIDRDRLRGSMRSGVEDYRLPDGSAVSAYFFSVDHRILPEAPWSDGWLYVLPRAGFERMPIAPGGPPSPEWCNREPVRPLGRIPIRPVDFPFLDRVAPHDDGPLLRWGELSDIVRAHVRETRATETGVVLHLESTDELDGAVEEYLELSRRFMPEVEQVLISVAADRMVELRIDAPPDLAAMFRNRYVTS